MNQATIFVVEDDKEFAELIKIRIETSGHRVLMTGDGDSAYELIQAKMPDLVVLDVFLPDTDGLTILKRLKAPIDIESGKPSVTKDIPIVVITGKAPMIENIMRIEGAADFFVKPVNVDKLVQRVCQLLELSQRDREPQS